MAATPWTTTDTIERDHTYLAVATRFSVTSRLRLPQVTSATQQLWSQLEEVDGLIGYSLQANVIAGSLATLTAWRDRDALTEFVHSERHTAVMNATRRWMSNSTIVTWPLPGIELPPAWNDANTRLDSSQQTPLIITADRIRP